jgi:hypothetical protein
MCRSGPNGVHGEVRHEDAALSGDFIAGKRSGNAAGKSAGGKQLANSWQAVVEPETRALLIRRAPFSSEYSNHIFPRLAILSIIHILSNV